MIQFIVIYTAMQIHDEQTSQLGGTFGLQDNALLESALHMPQAQFGGEFLHSTIYEMAAVYGFHICKNHPFIDGNKRTTHAIMFLFLQLNGFDFQIDEQEHYTVMMAVAKGEMTKQQLAQWLQKVTFNPS